MCILQLIESKEAQLAEPVVYVKFRTDQSGYQWCKWAFSYYPLKLYISNPHCPMYLKAAVLHCQVQVRLQLGFVFPWALKASVRSLNLGTSRARRLRACHVRGDRATIGPTVKYALNCADFPASSLKEKRSNTEISSLTQEWLATWIACKLCRTKMAFYSEKGKQI